MLFFDVIIIFMLNNEILFFLLAISNSLIIFLVARINHKWLYSMIGVNLILVNIFGQKIVEVFGFVTNCGNIFYASAFLATYFLINKEPNNKNHPLFYGLIIISVFLILSQIANLAYSLQDSTTVDSSLKLIFKFSPNIGFASLIAYIFAQKINIWIYIKTKNIFQEKFLWLQINSSNIISQLVDSMFFFTLAFIDMPSGMLLQAIFFGWIIKISTIIIGTPFVYLDRYIDKKHHV